MERTDKAKIALAVLIILIIVRIILQFFPTPLDFAPYTANGNGGELQTVTAIEIRLILTETESANGKAQYYYQIRKPDTPEGQWDGIISDSILYMDEVFENPVVFTGRTFSIMNPQDIAPEQAEYFYESFRVSDALLAEQGNKIDAYASVCDTLVLDISFRDRTTDNIACKWVSVAALIVFVCMLALLLKEYVAGSSYRK